MHDLLQFQSVASPMRRRLLQAMAATGLLLCLPQLAFGGAYDDWFKAIKLDLDDQVRTLLRRGIDPNTVDEQRGDTALILAAREGSTKVFNLLLQNREVKLDARARNGETALMLAAYKGNLPAVRALLDKGAEPNQTGWTALHYAATVGNNDIVQLLLDRSAYIDAESPNQTTPIMMAARGGHILTVKLLLDEGADATLKNGANMTAIDFAREGGFKDIVEGLTYRLKKAGKM